MDLTRRIQTTVQVIEEESDPSDPEASREHYLELRRLLEELRSLSMIPPRHQGTEGDPRQDGASSVLEAARAEVLLEVSSIDGVVRLDVLYSLGHEV